MNKKHYVGKYIIKGSDNMSKEIFDKLYKANEEEIEKIIKDSMEVKNKEENIEDYYEKRIIEVAKKCYEHGFLDGINLIIGSINSKREI